MSDEVTCDICGKVIDGDNAHYPHDEDCPNLGHCDFAGWLGACWCSNVCCEDCCPECKLAEVPHD